MGITRAGRVAARMYRRIKRRMVKCGVHPIDAAFDAALIVALHEEKKAYKASMFYKLAS